MTIGRRKFLQLGTLASASLLIPDFLSSLMEKAITSSKKLIVLQLSGGNDGLNTVIPYGNDIYFKSRPSLAIARGHALKLTDEAGLHPSLKGLRDLFNQGYVSIINSVGYPDPSRSHFRSMDIWHSGSTTGFNTGWIGRHLDEYGGRNGIALEMDERVGLALRGVIKQGLPLYAGCVPHNAQHDATLTSYFSHTDASYAANTEYMFNQAKIRRSVTEYPDTQLGKRMKMISSLIKAGTDTEVYYASLGSFDTHVNQLEHHGQLLSHLDESLSCFVADLKRDHCFNDVLILVFSEFGRRVTENKSKGTDHGTANNIFLVSGVLKRQGILNNLPNLRDLNEGDLKYKVDFRQVYATILDRWFEGDSRKVLGAQFPQLDFV